MSLIYKPSDASTPTGMASGLYKSCTSNLLLWVTVKGPSLTNVERSLDQ